MRRRHRVVPLPGSTHSLTYSPTNYLHITFLPLPCPFFRDGAVEVAKAAVTASASRNACPCFAHAALEIRRKHLRTNNCSSFEAGTLIFQIKRQKVQTFFRLRAESTRGGQGC